MFPGFSGQLLGRIQSQNPFLGDGQGGLLGGAFRRQPAQNQYEQMAAPYAQWAAQQLQQVAPETQVPQQQQWNDPQQQALAQMWNYYQNQQRIYGY